MLFDVKTSVISTVLISQQMALFAAFPSDSLLNNSLFPSNSLIFVLFEGLKFFWECFLPGGPAHLVTNNNNKKTVTPVGARAFLIVNIPK